MKALDALAFHFGMSEADNRQKAANVVIVEDDAV